MTFGTINIWLWIALFVGTLLYEWLTVVCTISILKGKSIAVANLSVAINVIGMGSVYAYTGEINNGIPILASVWLGNYLAVEYERKKRERDDKDAPEK